MVRKLLFSLASVLALAGCASAPPKPRPTVMPPYAATLAAVSRQVAAAWENTARQSHVFRHPPHLPALADAPVSLQQIVRIDWVGPPLPLLRQLAVRAGWHFLVLGSPPPSTTVVTIAGRRAIMSDLEQVGSQLTDQRVVVDARSRTLILDARP